MTDNEVYGKQVAPSATDLTTTAHEHGFGQDDPGDVSTEDGGVVTEYDHTLDPVGEEEGDTDPPGVVTEYDHLAE